MSNTLLLRGPVAPYGMQYAFSLAKRGNKPNQRCVPDGLHLEGIDIGKFRTISTRDDQFVRTLKTDLFLHCESILTRNIKTDG
jgi:hypothetical protein